ncbi:hypothetical protein [Streptomyces sp. WAC 01325]|uniref:hypothetical protein n=1 Tax=Streptomyces sp. WAC 01325 TaxID=2203202 RepID=UPI00163CCB7B|nr:hypothetical protein [Streptomyces sp. WAC 01325]
MADLSLRTCAAASSTTSDNTLANVRSALGLSPYWTPRAEFDETQTRASVWSQLELNDVYERIGGTVTSRQVERTDSDGIPWTATEITLTTDVPGVGTVETFTDLYDGPAEYGYRDDLPVLLALAETAQRCPAALPGNTSPCDGPVAVLVLDAQNAGAEGCEHHAARLLARLDGGRPVALPDAPAGAALRVFTASGDIRRGESA